MKYCELVIFAQHLIKQKTIVQYSFWIWWSFITPNSLNQCVTVIMSAFFVTIKTTLFPITQSLEDPVLWNCLASRRNYCQYFPVNSFKTILIFVSLYFDKNLEFIYVGAATFSDMSDEFWVRNSIECWPGMFH